ncbi:MAG TPA: ABC transporter permease [Chthoniobacterales bacterium]|nr:ABC transporter permease [Chthoniobacterales bacterium]
MIPDLKYAFRTLSKTPGFTFIAVVTLALGIGLNTAIFSLINDLFLRGLSFKEPQRVVHMYSNARERNLLELAVSVPRFQHYRESQTVFDGFAAESVTAFTLTGLGDAVQIFGGRATWDYFDVLGIKPIRGRNFLPAEEQSADVALVTENFWRNRTGGDPNIVGRGVTLDGVLYTIVGVIPNLPFSWVGPAAEVWTTKPYFIPGIPNDRIMRGSGVLRVVGRLKPGMTLEQARAAMPALEQSYRAQYPGKIDSSSVMTLKTLPDDTTGSLRPAFAILLAAVAFVLLIACSNVANLLLVRFSGRRREIALRMAIGAPRGSVVRLFVLESLLVSLLAGILGVLLAWYIVPIIPRMAANFLPFDPDVRVDLSLPVLGFTIAMSVLTGLAMGIYPAVQSAKADLVEGLKEGGRGSSGSAHQLRFRKILIGAQVAFSVTLLAGAALLITSFVRLSQQNIGYRTDDVWFGFITLPDARYPDLGARQRFAEQALAALRDVPGLQSATLSADIPLFPGAGSNFLYTRTDGEILPIDKRAAAAGHNIAPDYLKMWGIPLLAGRGFDEHDTADSPKVILISQGGAKKIFGNENPIGKTLLIGSASLPAEIVGVVGDVRSRKVGESDDVELYRPWAQENFPFLGIYVRSNLTVDAVTKLVRSAVAKVDPGLAIAIPQSMNTIVAQAIGQSRLMMWLLAIFAAVALLLASIGIYGAVAYSVAQRTGEIGVRMALGAQATDILRLVLSQGVRPVIFGLIAGLAAALALGRLIASQLYQTSAHNPLLLAATIFLLLLAALLACLFPARRAMKVDPIIALRYE